MNDEKEGLTKICEGSSRAWQSSLPELHVTPRQAGHWEHSSTADATGHVHCPGTEELSQDTQPVRHEELLAHPHSIPDSAEKLKGPGGNGNGGATFTARCKPSGGHEPVLGEWRRPGIHGKAATGAVVVYDTN